MRPGCLLFFQIVFLLSGFRVLAQRNIPANELESAYGIFPAMEIKKIAGDFYRNGTDPKAVEKITGTGSAVILTDQTNTNGILAGGRMTFNGVDFATNTTDAANGPVGSTR